jgi:hypothetical protein
MCCYMPLDGVDFQPGRHSGGYGLPSLIRVAAPSLAGRRYPLGTLVVFVKMPLRVRGRRLTLGLRENVSPTTDCF